MGERWDRKYTADSQQSQAKKSIPVTSTFRMLRQKDGKFRASLSYTDIACLKNTNTKRKKKTRKQKPKIQKKRTLPPMNSDRCSLD